MALIDAPARVLRSGGRILIVDMLPHDRTEYQQQMGHVWLGFPEHQLRRLLTGAGFVSARIQPLPIGARTAHQVGMPYHFGRRGLVTGDSVNDLLPLVLDLNTHISEYKVATCDIQPGRRPRGRALLAYVEEYRRRAGVAV